jgi:2-polyprenyl-3-methyl-5-hydroxy-6-metoxy-1,4-benzoquinol methylase
MTTTPVAVRCVVCGNACGEPIYGHERNASVSSQALTLDIPTIVYACRFCGHVQTRPLDEIGRYYDQTYNVHLESDEADDLYDMREGAPVYRNEHQAVVALEKLALPPGASVLDFGCGKGTTLRAMLAARPDLDAAVFDVSDNYRPYWDRFIPTANQASFETPTAWKGRFDVVLTFFALEHVAQPDRFLRAVWALIKPGGTLHLVVPNIRRNIGDLIVVDHVNHFMPSSLRYAFAVAGFEDLQIDETAHVAAYVIDAKKGPSPSVPRSPESDVARYVCEALGYAAFWSGAGDAVAAFEHDIARGRKSAIYGSGLYGVFIAGRLADPSNLAYFLDQNPHQQAKRIFERQVLPPDALGDDIEVVYAALNPARAREIIAGVPSIHRRPRDVFYLEGEAG